VPPGASPHTYEPTPSQLKDVANSDLYLMVGSGVEFELDWSQKILQMNEHLAAVNTSQNISLIHMEAHEHGEEDDAFGGHEEHVDEQSIDPHVWTSPRNAKKMAVSSFEAIAQADPGNRDFYKSNLDSYLLELDSLDANMTLAASNIPGGKILVYHPSFGYLAHDYGFEQIAIEEDGKEPTAKGLASIISQARLENISVVFASPQFSVSSAETVAGEIGGTVVLVDPLAKDYVKNMASIASEISK
jgi:zinc transport system substrate-binding protein